MKAFIRNIIYLFYRYYDKGSTKEIAYESAILAVQGLLFLNGYAVLLLCRLDKYIRFGNSDSRLWRYLFTFGVFVLLGFLILKRIFSLNEIKEVQLSENMIKKGNGLLLIYIFISIIALTFVIVLK